MRESEHLHTMLLHPVSVNVQILSTGQSQRHNVSTTQTEAKVHSFTSEHAPLTPSNENNSFFHAKDGVEKEPPSRQAAERFFFTSNPVKNVPSTTVNKRRRLSNPSQYSSFATAKVVVSHRIELADDKPLSQSTPTPQPRSPTKPAFFLASDSAFSVPPTVSVSPSNHSQGSQSSSLRTVIDEPTSPHPQSSLYPTPNLSLLEITSTPSQSESATSLSKDERPKTLLPSGDLESSARINRNATPAIVHINTRSLT
jgi:hypothetical protein